MSSTPSAAEIMADARWLAQALEATGGAVRMVALSPEDYRAASFLDDRVLQEGVEAEVLRWEEVAAGAAGIRRDDARWIFHIGHVGSTLVARLLGELPGVLAVREPRFLRDLAALGPVERAAFIAPSRALFSRSFAPDQMALIKATSFVSEIAGELIPPGGRALFLYATPRNYVGTILAGENSINELPALAPGRAKRMAKRVHDLPPPRNEAELAAAAWACEMTALEAAAEALPGAAILWLDFDRLLGDVAGDLRRIVTALELSANDSEVAALAVSPLLKRYSKAPEYDYSASLRRDLIADATAHFASDIKGALDLLARSAETSPLLARALNRAGEK